LDKIKEEIFIPCIIKPSRLGSSVGINIVEDIQNFENGLKTALKFENKVIVEPLLKDFREFNCSCFIFHNEYITSTIEEIKNIHSILTYEDKYQNKEVKKELPALISEELTNEIKNLTKRIYQLFNLKGIVRIDYIYKDDTLYVNEINNIPGSLAYYLFTKEGISFTKLIDMQIKEAIKNKQNRIFNNIEHYEILNKNNLNNIKK
jgi:D-alanine-D-alanine ligase